MGADRIIAVDISSPLLERETLRSVLDVTNQLTNLLTRQGLQQQRNLLGEQDILLTPVFQEDLSSVTFGRIKDSIQAGYDIVMRNRELFEPLSLGETDYAAHVAGLVDPRMQELPVVDFVHLENRSEIADSVVQTRLRDIEVGQPLDLDAVEQAMNKVYGLEYYQNVRYGLVTENGSTGLEVELDPRSWGPNYLQLGMEYSSASDADALFGLAASYLATAINELGGEWRATFYIGDEPGLVADLYQPFGDEGLYFIAPTLDFGSDIFSVYDGDQLLTEARVRESRGDFGFGRELPSWGEVRVGMRFADGEVEVHVGDPTLVPDEDYQRRDVFARFAVDTMDSVAFPRAGVLASVEWRGSNHDSVSQDVDFDQLLLSAAVAKTWGRHTVLSTLRYDATISGQAPLNGLFRLGGFFDLSGLNKNQLSGQHAMRIGGSYYRRIGDLALFPAFAGVSVELGNVWNQRSAISFGDTIFGGSFWAGISTPVGPVYVGIGRAEGGESAFYVTLGRIF
jgi:NTE family protein